MIRNDGPSRFYDAGAILNCHSPAVTARHYLEFARLERKEPDRERKIRSGLSYFPSARSWIRTCGHLYKQPQDRLHSFGHDMVTLSPPRSLSGIGRHPLASLGLSTGAVGFISSRDIGEPDRRVQALFGEAPVRDRA